MQPRILLAGNAVAACLALDITLEATPTDRVLVVAPPGGPHHAWQGSLAELAHGRGVELLTPDDVNETTVVARLREWQPELALSIGYTQLFGRPLLDAVACPFVNFHPALLPRHRGVAPLVWAMVEGDETTGVTAHLIDSGVDTGMILDQLSMPMHPDETGYELHLKVAQLTSEMCARLLRGWLEDERLQPGRPQVGVASLHRTRDATLNAIVPSDGWKRIRDIVRALHPPFPGATLELAGRRIVVGSVERVTQELDRRPAGTIAVLDGAIILHTGDEPLVVTSWFEGDEERDGSLLAEAIEGQPT